MCGGAICGDNHTARPWWPTEQRWDISPYKKVYTDCCARKVFACETVCRIRSQEIPVGGWGDYQAKLPWPPFEAENWSIYASYYDPTWEVRCNPDGGCNVNRRKLCGASLRASMLESA